MDAVWTDVGRGMDVFPPPCKGGNVHTSVQMVKK